jgi:hypothetical protein
MLEFVSIEGSPKSYRVIVEIHLTIKVCSAATPDLLIC